MCSLFDLFGYWKYTHAFLPDAEVSLNLIPKLRHQAQVPGCPQDALRDAGT